jgi:hypothetical protein
MATTGYLDIGAVQRIESGSEVSGTAYLDIGAVQRQEAVVVLVYKAPPISDVSDAGWLSSLGGALYLAVDETTPDDTNYIYDPNDETTCELMIAPVTDPQTSAGFVLHYRAQALWWSSSVVATLMCGATQIKQWTDSLVGNSGVVEFDHALATTDVDAIRAANGAATNNFQNLRIRFSAVQ